MLTRRTLLASSLWLLVAAPAACKKEPRCAYCGMKLDPASAWTSELVLAGGEKRTFDTPRCALSVWRTIKSTSTPRFQDFYDRAWHDGAELRFVVGSDVVGPMGADFVPVTPDRAQKLAKDHGGRVVSLADVTPELVGDPK